MIVSAAPLTAVEMRPTDVMGEVHHDLSDLVDGQLAALERRVELHLE